MNSRPFFYSLFFLISFASHFLTAGIEDHFKSAKGKSPICHMKNIDYIYLINLDRRPEKFAHCFNELEPYGIIPYRFSGVNGWDLPVSVINQLGVCCDTSSPKGRMATWYPEGFDGKKDELMEYLGRTYFAHGMTRGAIGIILSHLSVLQDAYDSGYEIVWIMEDDVKMIRDPHLISDKIDELNLTVGEQGWDILFTDQDTKDKRGNYVICLSHAWRPNFVPTNPERFSERRFVGESFIQVGARYGAYSYVIKRQGIKKILDFIKTYQIFLPYDMEYTLPNDIKLFTVIEDIVSTDPQAISDNESPNYLNKNNLHNLDFELILDSSSERIESKISAKPR